MKAHLILLHFALLPFADIALFLQIEGKTLHQQKDYNLLKIQMMVSIF